MLLWFLFFLSGLAGLVYQILWVRELVLVFGATTFAIATVLSSFMGGLALGSHLFGKHADRLVSPLRVYAFLEIGIGLYALIIHSLFGALIPVYQILWEKLHLSFYSFSILRFFFVSLILLFPTACMGGTLPLLASHAARRDQSSSTVVAKIGGLYAINIAGAVLGVLLSSFLFLPTLGTARTTFLAASLNILIGAGAFFLSLQMDKSTPPLSYATTTMDLSPKRSTQKVLLVTFALSGLAAMVYEVVWTRLLTQILGSTIYSFATLLATFLLGLAAGSAFFSYFSRRLKQPIVTLGVIQCGIGLLAFTGEYLFGRLPTIFLGLVSFLHSEPQYLPAAKFLIAALVMFPATFLMGAVFPVTLRLLMAQTMAAGKVVGRAYAYNTMGTIVGSFLAGFVLLPLLGIQLSILLAVTLNLGLSLLLLLTAPEPTRLRTWVTAGTLAVITLGILHGPSWNPLSLSSGIFGKSRAMDLLFYKEGLNATVTVAEHPTLDPMPHLTLAIDGKANASTAGDMPTQILVGQLPLLLSPQPEKALVIGLGSGITLGSITQHPLKEIVTVELEPAVVEGSHYFDAFNSKPLEDPRVRLLVDDARNYLLVTQEKFDIIVSEPSHPWRSGSAKLFTKEFFELGRSHLNPNGIFTQWIHFYGIKPRELKGVIRTFHTVFPEILVFYTAAGDLILLGGMAPFQIDPIEIGRRMSVPRVMFELSRIKVTSVYDLFGHFILGTKEVEAYIGPGPLNTDDDTFVEFQTPKSLFEDTLSIHLAEMNRHHPSAAAYLAGDRSGENLFDEEGERIPAIETYMAEAYQKHGRLDQAERSVRRAIVLRPTADRYRRLALILEGQDRESDARGAWASALALDPEHRESLLDLTRVEQERGNLSAMGEYVDRWKIAHPDDPLLPYYDGILLYYKGNPTASLHALERAGIRGGPLANYYRSLALTKLSREKEAQEALARLLDGLNTQRKLLEENPKRYKSLPIINAAKFRSDRGIQIPEEERLYMLFQRVVEEPLDHFFSGMGLYMLGLYNEAGNELSKGLDKLGERRHGSLGQFYLGLAHKRMGRYQEAVEQLQAYLVAGGDGGFRVIKAEETLEEISRIQKLRS